MFKVTVRTLSGNEFNIYYPGDKDYVLSNAVLTYDVGLAGEFNFTIPFGHPSYDQIVQNSIITVYKDNVEFWRGDIRNIKTKFDKSLEVYCLEDLAWLGDEPLAMVQITNQTYSQRFTNALTSYNENQVAKRQFAVGQITAVSSSAYCTWVPEYGMSVLDGLRTFIAGANGFLKVRRVTSNGTVTRNIDIVLLSDYGKQSSQTIEFGSNLLDYTKDFDATNIINALYPYGAETETELYGEIMQRISGTPIQNDASISAFGRRAKTVVFDTDNVTTLNNLALAYLSRYSQPHVELEISAVDLGSISDVDDFAIGDSVRVLAPTYAIDQRLYITHMDVDFLNPASNQINLTDELRKASLTSQVATQAEDIKDIRTPASVLDEAKRNAWAIFEGDNGGIVTFDVNGNEQIVGIHIANNLDLSQATKAWGWNVNGLVYLHRTYPSDDWTVGVAITMNGEIVADYITVGTLNAAQVDVINLNASNIVTGTIKDAYNRNFWNLLTGDMAMTGGAALILENTDYSGDYVPLINNWPSAGWSDATREANVGKTFKDTSTGGKTYIYSKGINSLETAHPYTDNANDNYVIDFAFSPAGGYWSLIFDAQSEIEGGSYDYLDFYCQNGYTVYKRTINIASGLGGLQISFYGSKLWIHWRTDGSIQKWGWKLTFAYTTTAPVDFTVIPALPSLSWKSLIYAYYWDVVTIQSYTPQQIDEHMTQEEIFNALTNGGQDQGIYIYNGKVYLNGQFIKAKSINADDIGTGTLTVGGSGVNKPAIYVKDSNDNTIGSWTLDGIDANKGKFGSLFIANNSVYTEGEIKLPEIDMYISADESSVTKRFIFRPSYLGASEQFYIGYDVTVSGISGEYEVAKQLGRISIMERSSSTSWVGRNNTYIDYFSPTDISTDISTYPYSPTDDQELRLQVTLNHNDVSNAFSVNVVPVLYFYRNGQYVRNTANFFLSGEKSLIPEMVGNLKGTADLTDLKCWGFNITRDAFNTYLNLSNEYNYGYDNVIRNLVLSPYTLNMTYSSNSLGEHEMEINNALGSIRKKENGVWTSVSWATSDRRIKKDIETLDNELSKNLIEGTKTYKYKFINSENEHHYGVLAQEVRELLDSLSEENAMLEHSMGDTNIKDQRNVDYIEYIPHLINYVKDLRAEINSLKAEINKLRKEQDNG